MRIQTNVAANTAYRNLGMTNMSLQKSVQRLSSGFRINRSGDDVSGLAIANALRNEGKALGAAQRNIVQGSSVLDIADGAVQQISQIVDRARELATTAASGNTSDADRAALDTEYQSLLDEIDRLVAETTYQGASLLDGTYNESFRVGAGSGATASIAVDLSVFANGVDRTGLTLNTTDLTSAANAEAVIVAITDAAGALARLRDFTGTIGAAQNRFQYAGAALAVQAENVAAAESVVRDLDVAAEMTQFTKFQILQQAGTAMLAQANSAPQSILSLLRG